MVLANWATTVISVIDKTRGRRAHLSSWHCPRYLVTASLLVGAGGYLLYQQIKKFWLVVRTLVRLHNRMDGLSRSVRTLTQHGLDLSRRLDAPAADGLTGWCTSQLKIVLLGGRNSGKSSVGNLILGKDEFLPKERTLCSRRLGVVAGQRLTIVDTPGWWCDFSAQDTSELVKREIITSITLCSPGPHVFLIIIKASSAFCERRRRAVEEHLALLGDTVWSHCMVVFTSDEKFKDTNPEEYVERGGKALRWLGEQCSWRCHSVVLSDNTEVTELLAKVQKLVTENENRVFEMQGNILQAVAEEKRAAEERAWLRFIRMKQHRSLMREKPRPVTDIRIVILGAKGSGKTSAANTILGRENSPKPVRTAQCQAEKGVVFGRQVTLVDTPGWWMNYFCDESSIFDQRELVLSLSHCPPGPHVFLLVIRVDRAFTETYRRATQEHLELISEHIWSRVVLLFSFGDWLGGTPIEQYVESEGEALCWIVERCGNRYHVLNSRTKGEGFQVRELIAKIEETLTSCNTDWHYELERKELDQLEGTKRRERERARVRLMKKEKQRQMARAQLENLEPSTQLRVVLVGGRKTGKSSCGNTILSRESFNTDTQTTVCTEKHRSMWGKMVVVLDTPGCCSVTCDLLKSSCAILLVVNVSSSFKKHYKETLQKELEALGEQLWSRTVVLFSYGDWLGDTSIEQRIESEGEPLQRLVEKCGNRYHVLDNKLRGDGAQVRELIEQIEEMLAEERLALRDRGEHMWEQLLGAEPELRPEQANDVDESSPSQSLSIREASPHIVASPAGRARERAGYPAVDRDCFMSHLFSLLSGLRLPKVTLRVPVPALQNHVSLNSEGLVHPVSHRLDTMHLVSSHTQNTTCVEQDLISARSLCQPALRERTLRRLSESGGLQALIDQWGNSSLEELEAFIDFYFEKVWEETMGSCQPPEPNHAVTEQDDAAPVEEAGQEEVLVSIDRKLSKLELLEEIRIDLAELRQSLESSWRAIQELKDASKQDPNNTC